MKKIFSLVAVMAMFLTAASCNGESEKGGALTDTVSANMGELFGYGFASGASQGPDSATFNKKLFLKGMEVVMTADSAASKKSFLDGIQAGLRLRGQMEYIKQQQKLDLNQKALMAAFKKAFLSDSTKTQEELMAMQQELMAMMDRAAREAKENDPVALKNKEEGQKFIDEKVKAGATLTESGLAYEVLAAGEGENFKPTDHIMVKYVGKHIDGREFDTTVGKAEGDAIEMSPMQVVAGFKEALLLMKPGAHFILYIPGHLGYGIDGAPGYIEPNETLVFDMETVALKEDTVK